MSCVGFGVSALLRSQFSRRRRRVLRPRIRWKLRPLPLEVDFFGSSSDSLRAILPAASSSSSPSSASVPLRRKPRHRRARRPAALACVSSCLASTRLEERAATSSSLREFSTRTRSASRRCGGFLDRGREVSAAGLAGLRRIPVRVHLPYRFRPGASEGARRRNGAERWSPPATRWVASWQHAARFVDFRLWLTEFGFCDRRDGSGCGYGLLRYFASDSPGRMISSSALDSAGPTGREPVSGRRLSKPRGC